MLASDGGKFLSTSLPILWIIFSFSLIHLFEIKYFPTQFIYPYSGIILLTTRDCYTKVTIFSCKYYWVTVSQINIKICAIISNSLSLTPSSA